MKKILTLVLSLGLITAAFAQDGHQGYNSKTSSVNPSYGNAYDQKMDGYKKGYTASYSNLQIRKHRLNERTKEFKTRRFESRKFFPVVRHSRVIKPCVK
jgi:hypothetical protein